MIPLPDPAHLQRVVRRAVGLPERGEPVVMGMLGVNPMTMRPDPALPPDELLIISERDGRVLRGPGFYYESASPIDP